MTAVAEIRTVAVLGMGTMGAGIAQVCAQADLDVIVLEASDERLLDGFERTRSFLEGGVTRGKLTPTDRDRVLARIRGTVSPNDLADADLVVEAVPEDLELKRQILSAVAPIVGGVVIATNTSALSVTEIASSVPSPERVGGLHFFNPAPLMRLVEVVAGIQTSEATLATLEEFAVRIGKEPTVTKDRPGFLVNRLLMPYLNQAVQDFDDGLASAEDLDAAVELGLGYPVGPLKLLDLIGLDVHHDATSAAWEQTRDPHFVPPPLLARLVSAGRIGRKSGRGFYKYDAHR